MTRRKPQMPRHKPQKMRKRAVRPAKLTRAEQALIDIAYAFEATEARTKCQHERWPYLVENHQIEVGAALWAAMLAKIKRDHGKCHFCGGSAKKCYPRHLNGRSCA